MTLEGKKLLITGVINRESIAYEVAKQAQAAGAEVVLTGFGRAKRMTDRSAAKLDPAPDVLGEGPVRIHRGSGLAEEGEQRGTGPGRRGRPSQVGGLPEAERQRRLHFARRRCQARIPRIVHIRAAPRLRRSLRARRRSCSRRCSVPRPRSRSLR